MKYRPEIDGLRAFAVVPVVMFHAGFTLFSGGFAGVDIFFVISGYLITTIIASELAAGKFSLWTFYERRMRRIAPALFLVVIACLPIAWMILMPRDMKDFAQSVVAVSVSASNFLFWNESGYFDSAAELKPLLHTWSLAVEEQYYILFPLFILLIWKTTGNRVVVILSALAAASLALGHWGSTTFPSAAFYLLPFRAWQILLGALVALYLLRQPSVREASLASQLGSLAGLFMILYAVFVFDEHVPFPGLFALVPVAGTCLVILFAVEGTLVNRFLQFPGFIWLGLVSYSAYLWHQPLFSFSRYLTVEELSVELTWTIVVLTFLLAWGSWWFVEKPFRNRTFLSRKAVFNTVGLVGGGLIAFGLWMNDRDGLPSRYDGRILEILSVEEGWQDTHRCAVSLPSGTDALGECTQQKPIVYLVGDSHADAISNQLRAAFEAKGITLVSWSLGACLPIRGTTVPPLSANHLCHDNKEQMLAHIEANPAPTIVVARWRIHIEGVRYDNMEGGVELGRDIHSEVIGEPEADVVPFIANELNKLAEKVPLVVVNQIPEPGWNVPSRVARFVLAGEPAEAVTTSYAVYKDSNRRVDNMLSGLDDRITLYRSDKLVCSEDTGRCENARDGMPLYRDEDHPSEALSELIARDLAEIVEGLE